MKIQYFAWLRERLNKSEEHVEPPAAVVTVSDLLHWLSARDETIGQALVNPKTVRVAIDAKISNFDASIVGASTVAVFPPMTGG